jgi:hypothetical protein
VAISPATRKEDDKLREALKNADVEKFKKLAKSALFPRKKAKKKPTEKAR